MRTWVAQCPSERRFTKSCLARSTIVFHPRLGTFGPAHYRRVPPQLLHRLLHARLGAYLVALAQQFVDRCAPPERDRVVTDLTCLGQLSVPDEEPRKPDLQVRAVALGRWNCLLERFTIDRSWPGCPLRAFGCDQVEHQARPAEVGRPLAGGSARIVELTDAAPGLHRNGARREIPRDVGEPVLP